MRQALQSLARAQTALMRPRRRRAYASPTARPFSVVSLVGTDADTHLWRDNAAMANGKERKKKELLWRESGVMKKE